MESQLVLPCSCLRASGSIERYSGQDFDHMTECSPRTTNRNFHDTRSTSRTANAVDTIASSRSFNDNSAHCDPDIPSQSWLLESKRTQPILDSSRTDDNSTKNTNLTMCAGTRDCRRARRASRREPSTRSPERTGTTSRHHQRSKSESRRSGPL